MDDWVREPPVALERRPPIFRVHCHSHRLQLSLKNAMTKLPSFSNLHFRFESTINGLYNFYNAHAVKRTANIKSYAKTWKHPYLQIRSIIKIRWISSQFPAINTLKSNYFLYVFHLKNLTIDEEFANDHTTVSAATGYLKELKTLDFALFLHFVIDVLKPIQDLCQALQKKLYSITRLHDDIQRLVSRLDDLKTGFGDSLQSFIDMLKCEKDFEQIPCTIQLFDDSDESVGIFMPMFHFFEDKLPAQNISFTRRRQKLNLNNLRDAVIPALINEFTSKFPENPILIKQLAILEPHSAVT